MLNECPSNRGYFREPLFVLAQKKPSQPQAIVRAQVLSFSKEAERQRSRQQTPKCLPPWTPMADYTFL